MIGFGETTRRKVGVNQVGCDAAAHPPLGCIHLASSLFFKAIVLY
jgi:hypothetical protein